VCTGGHIPGRGRENESGRAEFRSAKYARQWPLATGILRPEHSIMRLLEQGFYSRLFW